MTLPAEGIGRVITFTLRTQVEERIQERLYGAEYARYRERTWRLIPFVF